MSGDLRQAAIEFPPARGGVRCLGPWTVAGAAGVERELAGLSRLKGAELVLDGSGIDAMDTSGAWLLLRTVRLLEAEGRRVTLQGLRPEHESLLEIVARRGPQPGRPTALPPLGFLARLGGRVWHSVGQAVGGLSFLGESALAALRSLARPAHIRWRPVLFNLHGAGFNALPITGLLSFLMGVVIAYQGAGQLQRYGANIFVADLVGLSMLRELAPLLTAIIVAGRSGSAFAAQIGTMKVTEEIDALRTIGISPMELLVLPKILALMIALPLLTIYADVLGVVGGMLMGRAQLGVGFEQFIDRFQEAINLSSYLVGLGKAPVFAAIIALVGCYQGFQVRGGADGVGRQTTVSVVQAIFLVIIVDALFSVIFSWLKI